MKVRFLIVLGVALAVSIPVFASDPCSTVKRELAYGMAAAEDAKEREDFARAAEEFEKAAKNAPGCAFAFFNLGVTHQQAGNYVKAKAAFERFIKLAPSDPDAEIAQQEVYKLEYRIKRAAEEKKKIEKSPSPEKMIQNLAGTWMTRQRKVRTLNDHYYPPDLNGPWETARHNANVVVTGGRIIVKVHKHPGMFIFNGRIDGELIEGRLTMEDNSGICPQIPKNYPFNGKIFFKSSKILLIARGATDGIGSTCRNDPNLYVWAFILNR